MFDKILYNIGKSDNVEFLLECYPEKSSKSIQQIFLFSLGLLTIAFIFLLVRLLLPIFHFTSVYQLAQLLVSMIFILVFWLAVFYFRKDHNFTRIHKKYNDEIILRLNSFILYLEDLEDNLEIRINDQPIKMNHKQVEYFQSKKLHKYQCSNFLTGLKLGSELRLDYQRAYSFQLPDLDNMKEKKLTPIRLIFMENNQEVT